MESNTIKFHINQDVIKLGVKGVYLIITGLKNKKADPDFESYKDSVLRKLKKEYSAEGFIDNDPILAGFRDLHTKVGRSNRRFISAPEMLVSRFLRIGTLPHINLLVDIYNLVSLKSGLALGAHDINKIDGNVSLRLTTGEELYIPLGATSPETVFPGEYAYIDESNEVICRMEVLQVDKTKVNLNSTDCFYIIQGNKNTSVDELNKAALELIDLTKKYCGGDFKILLSSEAIASGKSAGVNTNPPPGWT